ncbi:MAG: hypothetical protein AB1589_37990 [Cyanobacteriota bacterium]
MNLGLIESKYFFCRVGQIQTFLLPISDYFLRGIFRVFFVSLLGSDCGSLSAMTAVRAKVPKIIKPRTNGIFLSPTVDTSTIEIFEPLLEWLYATLSNDYQFFMIFDLFFGVTRVFGWTIC